MFHVHYHLIPRTGRGDGLGYRWKIGRMLPKEQIAEFQAKARAFLSGQAQVHASAAEDEGQWEGK